MRGRDLVLTLALAGALAAPAGAQELTGTLKKIKDTGAITIGHRDASMPFSYLDDKQQPVGYAMDICAKIVDAVKKRAEACRSSRSSYNPVTSANRIPLMANGTIDLECGSTTNNARRARSRSPSPTPTSSPPTATSRRSRRRSKTLDDLKGKTVVVDRRAPPTSSSSTR